MSKPKFMYSEVFDATKDPCYYRRNNSVCLTPYTFKIFEEDVPEAFWFPAVGGFSECGFSTRKEASDFKKLLETRQDCRFDAYLVFDFSDPQSEELTCKAMFQTRLSAHLFILSQKGKQGRTTFYRYELGSKHFTEKLYAVTGYSDFELQPMNFR